MRAGIHGGCLSGPCGRSGHCLLQHGALCLFFPKKQEPALVRYSAFDWELLVYCADICHFQYLLEDPSFSIYTGHKQLTFALSKVADAWTAMQCRKLPYVADLYTDIRHVPVDKKIVADMLSRPPSHTARPDSCLPAHDLALY